MSEILGHNQSLRESSKKNGRESANASQSRSSLPDVPSRHFGRHLDPPVLDPDLPPCGEHARLDGRDDLVGVSGDGALVGVRIGAGVSEVDRAAEIVSLRIGGKRWEKVELVVGDEAASGGREVKERGHRVSIASVQGGKRRKEGTDMLVFESVNLQRIENKRISRC